jgi:hypothetical protein
VVDICVGEAIKEGAETIDSTSSAAMYIVFESTSALAAAIAHPIFI